MESKGGSVLPSAEGLIHEAMPKEARAVAEALRRVYDLTVRVQEGDVSQLLPELPLFDGRLAEPVALLRLPSVRAPGIVALVRSDLFMNDKSKDDDWAFGVAQGGFVLVSSARLCPAGTNEDQGLRRIAAVAVHEVGHDVVSGPHLRQARWVNVARGYELPLDLHCGDPRCAMYEVADLTAPSPEEGHILLGDEIRHDIGLDELLDRIYDDWLCASCRASIKVLSYWKD